VKAALINGRVMVALETPDNRLNGQYQFVKGWTGGGAEMCAHMTPDEYKLRVREKLGDGELVEHEGKFYWHQTPITLTSPTQASE
jgi:hypothetical protein